MLYYYEFIKKHFKGKVNNCQLNKVIYIYIHIYITLFNWQYYIYIYIYYKFSVKNFKAIMIISDDTAQVQLPAHS